MNRGDTKILQFKIKKSDGTYVDGADYDEVEVQFNEQRTYSSLKYLKSEGTVGWDTDHFYVSMSQQDTYRLSVGQAEMQVRLYDGGVCKGTSIANIDVGRTLSGKVLGDDADNS